jgi:hypothetical protein
VPFPVAPQAIDIIAAAFAPLVIHSWKVEPVDAVLRDSAAEQSELSRHRGAGALAGGAPGWNPVRTAGPLSNRKSESNRVRAVSDRPLPSKEE